MRWCGHRARRPCCRMARDPVMVTASRPEPPGRELGLCVLSTVQPLCASISPSTQKKIHTNPKLTKKIARHAQRTNRRTVCCCSRVPDGRACVRARERVCAHRLARFELHICYDFVFDFRLLVNLLSLAPTNPTPRRETASGEEDCVCVYVCGRDFVSVCVCVCVYFVSACVRVCKCLSLDLPLHIVCEA